MRRFLRLSLRGAIIIAIPLIAYTLVCASPEPGAPAYWSAAGNISNSPNGITAPRIAVDGNGYLHLIWIDNRTGNGDLYYTKSTNKGISWSAFAPIRDARESRQPDIELGPDGTVHVAFVEVWNESYQEYNIKYAKKPPGGAWQTSRLPGRKYQHSPAIAMNDNYLYIAWARQETGNFQIYYSYKLLTGDTWSTPEPVATTATTSLYPDIITDSHGNVHVVWQENVNGGAIWYSKGSWNDGTLVWSTPTTISQSLAGCSTPAIAVGSDDYLHVVWGRIINRDKQYVYYANFPYNDTSSITPVKVFTKAVGVSAEAPTYLFPRIAIGGKNEIRVVWHGKRATDITDQIWYAVSEDKGNSWSSPIDISRQPTRQGLAPDIALDGKMGHVVWQGKDESDKYQVMYLLAHHYQQLFGYSGGGLEGVPD